MKTVIWLLLTGGCLDRFEPDVGPPLRAICNNVDSDPATSVRFEAEIRAAIFERADLHCTRCHTAAGETPIGLDVGGLDLASYQTLLRGGVQSGADLVRPGDPCGSVLVLKLGVGPPFGARMPLDGPPHATARDIQIIADWISEGAHDN
ncbi:MAG: hypothetical protein WKG01_32975 [Kofleriaceae bacterium]